MTTVMTSSKVTFYNEPRTGFRAASGIANSALGSFQATSISIADKFTNYGEVTIEFDAPTAWALGCLGNQNAVSLSQRARYVSIILPNGINRIFLVGAADSEEESSEMSSVAVKAYSPEYWMKIVASTIANANTVFKSTDLYSTRLMAWLAMYSTGYANEQLNGVNFRDLPILPFDSAYSPTAQETAWYGVAKGSAAASPIDGKPAATLSCDDLSNSYPAEQGDNFFTLEGSFPYKIGSSTNGETVEYRSDFDYVLIPADSPYNDGTVWFRWAFRPRSTSAIYMSRQNGMISDNSTFHADATTGQTIYYLPPKSDGTLRQNVAAIGGSIVPGAWASTSTSAAVSTTNRVVDNMSAADASKAAAAAAAGIHPVSLDLTATATKMLQQVRPGMAASVRFGNTMMQFTIAEVDYSFDSDKGWSVSIPISTKQKSIDYIYDPIQETSSGPVAKNDDDNTSTSDIPTIDDGSVPDVSVPGVGTGDIDPGINPGAPDDVIDTANDPLTDTQIVNCISLANGDAGCWMIHIEKNGWWVIQTDSAGKYHLTQVKKANDDYSMFDNSPRTIISGNNRRPYFLLKNVKNAHKILLVTMSKTYAAGGTTNVKSYVLAADPDDVIGWGTDNNSGIVIMTNARTLTTVTSPFGGVKLGLYKTTLTPLGLSKNIAPSSISGGTNLATNATRPLPTVATDQYNVGNGDWLISPDGTIVEQTRHSVVVGGYVAYWGTRLLKVGSKLWDMKYSILDCRAYFNRNNTPMIAVTTSDWRFLEFNASTGAQVTGLGLADAGRVCLPGVDDGYALIGGMNSIFKTNGNTVGIPFKDSQYGGYRTAPVVPNPSGNAMDISSTYTDVYGVAVFANDTGFCAIRSKKHWSDDLTADDYKITAFAGIRGVTSGAGGPWVYGDNGIATPDGTVIFSEPVLALWTINTYLGFYAKLKDGSWITYDRVSGIKKIGSTAAVYSSGAGMSHSIDHLVDSANGQLMPPADSSNGVSMSGGVATNFWGDQITQSGETAIGQYGSVVVTNRAIYYVTSNFIRRVPVDNSRSDIIGFSEPIYRDRYTGAPLALVVFGANWYADVTLLIDQNHNTATVGNYIDTTVELTPGVSSAQVVSNIFYIKATFLIPGNGSTILHTYGATSDTVLNGSFSFAIVSSSHAPVIAFSADGTEFYSGDSGIVNPLANGESINCIVGESTGMGDYDRASIVLTNRAAYYISYEGSSFSKAVPDASLGNELVWDLGKDEYDYSYCCGNGRAQEFDRYSFGDVISVGAKYSGVVTARGKSVFYDPSVYSDVVLSDIGNELRVVFTRDGKRGMLPVTATYNRPAILEESSANSANLVSYDQSRMYVNSSNNPCIVDNNGLGFRYDGAQSNAGNIGTLKEVAQEKQGAIIIGSNGWLLGGYYAAGTPVSHTEWTVWDGSKNYSSYYGSTIPIAGELDVATTYRYYAVVSGVSGGYALYNGEPWRVITHIARLTEACIDSSNLAVVKYADGSLAGLKLSPYSADKQNLPIEARSMVQDSFSGAIIIQSAPGDAQKTSMRVSGSWVDLTSLITKEE